MTPGSLIEGIITEEGVVPRDPATGTHKVKEFMDARQQRLQQQANGTGGQRDASSSCPEYTRATVLGESLPQSLLPAAFEFQFANALVNYCPCCCCCSRPCCPCVQQCECS